MSNHRQLRLPTVREIERERAFREMHAEIERRYRELVTAKQGGR